MKNLINKSISGTARAEYIEVKPYLRLLITVAGIGRKISLCVLLFIALSACNNTSELQSDRPANFTDKQWLGKQLFFDTNLSEPAGLACAGCHASQVGWTGPDALTDLGGAAYEGAVKGRFGNSKPPSSAYGGDSPILHFDATNGWTGGMFWDGRATGLLLGDPLAEQAIGPFLNPLEQNNASAGVVVEKVKQSKYANLFIEVWGTHAFEDTEKAYQMIGRSIAEYERSREMSPFNSRFDTYLETGNGLTAQETLGLSLFNGKAKCANCHSSTANPVSGKVLFTDFTYTNIGVPKNPENPFYSELASNPLGASWVDLGLGGYLKSANFVASVYEPEFGKFKVPTLRNVDKRPNTSFIKAYGHNGYFKSLEGIVHFYNTRDVPGAGWPVPEYAANMTSEVGNLGLTTAEEEAIVSFLKTLTDSK
jgi:cytochrome c peroxidase